MKQSTLHPVHLDIPGGTRQNWTSQTFSTTSFAIDDALNRLEKDEVVSSRFHGVVLNMSEFWESIEISQTMFSIKG